MKKSKKEGSTSECCQAPISILKMNNKGGEYGCCLKRQV